MYKIIKHHWKKEKYKSYLKFKYFTLHKNSKVSKAQRIAILLKLRESSGDKEKKKKIEVAWIDS